MKILFIFFFSFSLFAQENLTVDQQLEKLEVILKKTSHSTMSPAMLSMIPLMQNNTSLTALTFFTSLLSFGSNAADLRRPSPLLHFLSHQLDAIAMASCGEWPAALINAPLQGISKLAEYLKIPFAWIPHHAGNLVMQAGMWHMLVMMRPMVKEEDEIYFDAMLAFTVTGTLSALGEMGVKSLRWFLGMVEKYQKQHEGTEEKEEELV